jgi:hypothetical protein
MAFVQTIVQQGLKAPATASFGSFTDETHVASGWKGGMDGKGCGYTVVSYVDSQNSFGALLRMGFWADVEYMPATGQWRLISFKKRDGAYSCVWHGSAVDCG